jgi:citrate lyase beta subunit
VGGEDVSVVCEDFAGEREALEAVARALDERRSLVLINARYDREADENGVIIHLANVVSVRVSKTDSATTGQYLWQLVQPAKKPVQPGEKTARGPLILPPIQRTR